MRTAAQPLPSLDTVAVHEALHAAVGEEVVGALVRVSEAGGFWEATAGSAETGSQRPVDPDGHFRIGSITKPFVATVVLQLVAEGRLALDSPVQQQAVGLLPDGPSPVTVRQLLQHTSGIPDYLPRVVQGPDQLLRDRFRSWTAQELLAVALAQPRSFEPGAGLGYSNTNYLLLGLLIQRITGRTWGEEAARRIIRPLALTSTSVPGDDPRLPRPHALGYTMTSDGAVVDLTEVNPSVWGAAGSMLSTARDLDTFLAALLAGELVAPPLLGHMLRPHPSRLPGVPFFRFGLGVQQLRLGKQHDGRVLYGGGGGVRGYTSSVFGTEDGRRRLVVSLTIATADEMRPARQLLDIVRSVFPES